MKEPFSALLESVMELEKELKLRMEVREAIIFIKDHTKLLEARVERLEGANVVAQGRHPSSSYDAVIELPDESVLLIPEEDSELLNIKGRGLVILVYKDNPVSDMSDNILQLGMVVRYRESLYMVKSVERYPNELRICFVVSEIKDNE